MVTRENIKDYIFLLREIDATKESIKKTEDEIEKLCEEGTVKDRVYGGEGGRQGYNIEGFPLAAYEKRVRLLKSRKLRLVEKENHITELREEIEKAIDEIPSSRDRQVIMSLFVDNKKQREVAEEFLVERSAVSKIVGKYFK